MVLEVVVLEVVVVVDVVDVVVVVEFVVEFGKVLMSEPSPVESSVSDPVRAPGVALLAPDRLATQGSLPETPKAENRLK